MISVRTNEGTFLKVCEDKTREQSRRKWLEKRMLQVAKLWLAIRELEFAS